MCIVNSVSCTVYGRWMAVVHLPDFILVSIALAHVVSCRFSVCLLHLEVPHPALCKRHPAGTLSAVPCVIPLHPGDLLHADFMLGLRGLGVDSMSFQTVGVSPCSVRTQVGV